MTKKKSIDFISISVATGIILFASFLVYMVSPKNQIELTAFQMQGLINSIKNTHFSQYPDFNELYFSGGKGYEIKNNSSDKLIIYMGPSSWGSAIERKWSGKLIDVFLTGGELFEKYSFFIPEKFDREIGALYGLDVNERQRYTVENLAENYYSVISEYLSINNYKSVIIYGAEEGAFLLPLLYSRLNSFNITALVSDSGGGGLTYFEQQQVLLDKLSRNEKSFASQPLSRDDKANLQNFYETWIRTFQTQRPESADFFMSSPMTYKWYTGIAHLKLSEYYEKINIPVLFIHGNLDTVVPVESTQQMENNYKNKPFDFYYYADMTHNQIKQQTYLPQDDITKWILKIDQ
ncbi:MAG: hypothetical protein FWC17_07260 [Treponema sp.]|nr:hypothetical protein [Treponema sp.]